MSKRLRAVGFVIKHRHEAAAELAQELGTLVLSKGRELVFCSESAALSLELERRHPKRVRVVEKAKLPDQVDLVVVLGGDGTLLSIARQMRKTSVPILGINMGQLGFLTEIKRDEAAKVLKRLLAGAKPELNERRMLEAVLKRKGKTVLRTPIVNDVVISKGAIARIITLQIRAGKRLINSFRADGVIVSTPSGSTAYSLAAGGPILEPTLPAVVISAICPHSLTQRPLVLPDDEALEIQVLDKPDNVVLTLDGQDARELRAGDTVVIRKFTRHPLRLISSSSRDYFALLREKLKFGWRD